MTPNPALLREAHQLRANWKQLHDVYRAETIQRLINAGVSQRLLGRFLGCSEGLIRHLKIVAQFSPFWKDQLLRGYYSTRQLVAEWRRQKRLRK